MYTYTTPTLTLKISGLADYIADVEFIRFAIIVGEKKVIKTVQPSEFDTETETVIINLTQEDTATLGEGKASVQGRVKYLNGQVQATKRVFGQMEDILDRVVI